MAKKTQTPFGIFTEASGLYFSNFDKFIKYMTFPVLGQIIGILLILFTTYIFTTNLPPLIEKYSSLNNMNTLILLSIIITLPGLAILIKAIWEYLVAYGAVNSMLDNMLKSGRVYDFDAHTELIKRKSTSFIVLWFLVGIFSTLAICPLFWIICGILAVYFILIFQVFTYEPEQSPIGCAKRSLNLIKGHFASTFVLAALAFTLTYIILPQLFTKLSEFTGFTQICSDLIMPVINLLPLSTISRTVKLTNNDIASLVIQSVIAQILIQYTLPFRSVLWALWYKELSRGERSSAPKSSAKKRPSEKLMESSHKKYGRKKLDKNILKRAMEKDDEE